MKWLNGNGFAAEVVVTVVVVTVLAADVEVVGFTVLVVTVVRVTVVTVVVDSGHGGHSPSVGGEIGKFWLLQSASLHTDLQIEYVSNVPSSLPNYHNYITTKN